MHEVGGGSPPGRKIDSRRVKTFQQLYAMGGSFRPRRRPRRPQKRRPNAHFGVRRPFWVGEADGGRGGCEVAVAVHAAKKGERRRHSHSNHRGQIYLKATTAVVILAPACNCTVTLTSHKSQWSAGRRDRGREFGVRVCPLCHTVSLARQ